MFELFFNNVRLTKRVGELEEDFQKLRRQVEGLELDWSNTYDKLRMMMARVVKRAEVAEKAEDGAGAEDALGLTPRQSLLQRQILSRRARVLRPAGGS